ncbi:MAG: hypothetical protein ACRDXD_02985 [Acidimicrobiia bacterium]
MRMLEWLSVALGDARDLLTTDHVLVETWLLLRHRLGRSAAEDFSSALWVSEPTGTADLDQ